MLYDPPLNFLSRIAWVLSDFDHFFREDFCNFFSLYNFLLTPPACATDFREIFCP